MIACYALRAALRNPLQVFKSFEVLWSVLFSKPDPIQGEIVFIAVKQEFRNQGLGQALVKAAMDYLSSQKVFQCRTKTLAENTNVIKMYEKMGWQMRNSLRLISHNYVIIVSQDNSTNIHT